MWNNNVELNDVHSSLEPGAELGLRLSPSRSDFQGEVGAPHGPVVDRELRVLWKGLGAALRDASDGDLGFLGTHEVRGLRFRGRLLRLATGFFVELLGLSSARR